MGVISDLLTQANMQSVDVTPPITSLDRSVVRELQGILDRQGDFSYPSDFDITDEVQVIEQYAGTSTPSGNFTLSFTLASGETFTTGNTAHDADAATIEGGIDTAATSASVAGWTNGDISVSGGPLASADVTLTFDGESVAGKQHGQTTLDGAGLTGVTLADPAQSTTTHGQGARAAWALLKLVGVISGTVPAQGEDPTGVTAGVSRAQVGINLSQNALRALIREAAIDDDNEAVETTLTSRLGL